MASARHRPTASIGPFRRFPPIAQASPDSPYSTHSIFPMGAVLTAALGQRGGKVGVEKLEMPPALPPKGPIFGRTQRRYYSALGPFFASGRTLLLVVGGVFSMLCCPRSASPTADKLALVIVIDRARGALAANWPARKSAIWNHLRTADADSLPVATSSIGFFTAIRGSHAPPSQSFTPALSLSPAICYTRSHRVV